MRKRKFYFKLLIAYVLIVFVYTLLVTSMFFYKNNEIVQLELKYRQDAFLREARDKIDTQLNIASNLVNQLKINSNVLEYAEKSERDYYVITRIYNELSKNIDAFANFGFTIGIGKQTDELIITPNNTINKERFYNEIGLEQGHKKEIEAALSTGNYAKSLFLHTYSGSGNRRITLIKKEPNLDLVFFVSFYESYLLPQMSGGSDGFALIKGDRIIAQNGSIERTALEQWITQQEENTSSEMTVRQLESKVFSDLKYAYIAEKMPISPQMRALAKDSLLVYLVLAVIGLLLAMLAANRTYRPIQKAVNQFKSYGEPVGRDELAFIQSTADGIHKLNENLKQTISGYKMPLRKKMISDLLFGLLSMKTAAPDLDAYNLTHLSGPVTVAIIEVAADRELEREYSNAHLFEITTQVTELIEQYLSREQLCETLGLDHKRFAVLLTEEDSPRLRQWLTYVLREISSSLSIQLVAAMGETAVHIGEAERSFQEAMKMMEYRFVMERKTLITADDLKQLRSTGYYYPLELERDLIAAVISGNADKAMSVMHKLLEENLDIRSLGIEKRSQFILAIVSTLNRISQQLERQEHETAAASEKWYPKLMLCSDVQQLKQAIYHLLHEMMNRIQDVNGKLEQSIAYQTVEFIHKHYDQDISLNDIAEQFNYSPSYISTLFKNHTGDNFRDYLNNVRVKRAKEIISGERGVKIQDLALRVGCNNANTFIRMFKRYEGVSPGQYAQNLE
ncbi:helix-turn-helix domain-containing protein [Paenibacillus radicis (ex Xue et al. 2023)]|uniref:Helix-turn-helix domain-containing protein n=1 Tax=Paenibacillus radicis (ex Xue et al. 2023) TaxID=2972489 RepID=A0ABT1YFB7_9BACL|nr:helix-turn-helix domain-containing protein [Paenibacillus radicis (ex Xue et al. 2023)]MCR8631617.1 helix-turn-helix domain-containing protein [Paenibacillus radicis (ex Xue et al. 2023)]